MTRTVRWPTGPGADARPAFTVDTDGTASGTAWAIARLVGGGAALVRAILSGDHERAARTARADRLCYCDRCGWSHLAPPCKRLEPQR